MTVCVHVLSRTLLLMFSLLMLKQELQLSSVRLSFLILNFQTRFANTLLQKSRQISVSLRVLLKNSKQSLCSIMKNQQFLPCRRLLLIYLIMMFRLRLRLKELLTRLHALTVFLLRKSVLRKTEVQISQTLAT